MFFKAYSNTFKLGFKVGLLYPQHTSTPHGIATATNLTENIKKS